MVAEVQSIFQDGAASLHTRSLKYGKLRNGVFLSVGGQGGRSGGVVRARRQMWSVRAGNGGGMVDVVLGVNGYIWICKHASVGGEEEARTEGGPLSQGQKIAITRLEDAVSGLRGDEERVMRAYDAALELEEGMRVDGEEEVGEYLGGERGKIVARQVLAGTN